MERTKMEAEHESESKQRAGAFTLPTGWWQRFADYPLKEYPPETEVARRGEQVVEVLLIRGGLIKLVWTNPRGTDTIVGMRSSGWPLGAAGAITLLPHPTSAETTITT